MKMRITSEPGFLPDFRALLSIISACLIFFVLVACVPEKESSQPKTERLNVVVSLFPLYDFARAIAGDRADVRLLSPPGSEPHAFEPRPGDMARISGAGLFIYTSPLMEPWAARVKRAVDGNRTRMIEAGKGVRYHPVSSNEDERHSHSHAGALDPHIWLDFSIDQLIVDNILAGFVAADPDNATFYQANAEILKARLQDMDARFRDGLKSCAHREFFHGGHYVFGYLARRYNLNYHALNGASSESEPSAAHMMSMIREIKRAGISHIFAEELLSPRLTETLATEAGVGTLKLHGAHNLSRDDFQRGVSFFDLMDDNLSSLRKGLTCR